MKYHIKGPGYEAIIEITDQELNENYSGNDEEVQVELTNNISLAIATLSCPEEDKFVLRAIDALSLDTKMKYLKRRNLETMVNYENMDPKDKPN